MRAPIASPAVGTPPPSMASTVYVEWFRQQPGSAAPDGTIPIGQLPLVSATLTDDAAMVVQRTMTLTLSHRPEDFYAGMWIRPTIGIRHAAPEVYQLPALIVTSIAADLSGSGVVVSAGDPSEVLNGRPYEEDTSISGYLADIVADICAECLARPTDVDTVPMSLIPASVAEFGTGRWDFLLRVAEAAGVTLRFSDAGDVMGGWFNDTPPEPVSALDGAVLPGGECRFERAPTHATLLATRGEAPALIGHADALSVTGVAPPAWYPKHVVTDRAEVGEGEVIWVVDILAGNLLRSRLADLQVYTGLPTLPAPWLEAGVDTVTYQGHVYFVRSLTLELPSMATTLTLRIVDPSGVPQ
jgi:hypothetical protein